MCVRKPLQRPRPDPRTMAQRKKPASSKGEEVAKTSAKAKNAPKAKSNSKGKAEAKTAIAKDKSSAKSSSGVPGKSIFGLAKNKYKAAYKGGQNWEDAWKACKQCQDVLSQMSRTERVKRRLDHLYKGD